METFLHRRAVRLVPARSRTRGDALGPSYQPAARAQQRQYASGRVKRISGAVAVASFAIVLSPAASSQDLRRGEALLTRNCGSCHAVGRSGESPDKPAPPFRTLGQRYPIESLEEALGEGIMSGHPDMPEFSFDAGDVGAIIAYLKSIQQR
ncbi:MAG: c-type cytochrome [Sphingobacteriales bacterium]